MPKDSTKCDSQTEENGVPEAYANLKTRTALRDLGTNNNAHQRARGTGGYSAQRRRQRDKEDEALAFCQRGRGRGRGLNTHQNRRPVPVMIDTRNVFQPTPIHIPRRNSTRLRNASARYLVVSITTTSNGRQCKLTLSDGRRYCSLFMPVWDDG